MKEFLKIRPCDTTCDREYQRDLKEHKVNKIASEFDPALVGVPVISKRASDELVIIDGQHRMFAQVQAGRGEMAILCEVHSGLTRAEEAALFHALNTRRSGIGAHDAWRSLLAAKDPIAMEIKGILDALGLRISRTTGRNCVCAVQAAQTVHEKNGNLRHTLAILKRWSDGVNPEAFDGQLIRCMSQFIKDHPEAKASEMVSRLEPLAPARVINRIKRAQGSDPDVPKMTAAVTVLREIYNTKNRNKLKVPVPVEAQPNGAAA